MSSEEIELLKVRLEARNELIKALFGGLKDLLVIAASVATLWIQTTNAGKIEVATKAATTTAAINTKWWAERTGDPSEFKRAEQAAKAVSDMQ